MYAYFVADLKYSRTFAYRKRTQNEIFIPNRMNQLHPHLLNHMRVLHIDTHVKRKRINTSIDAKRSLGLDPRQQVIQAIVIG